MKFYGGVHPKENKITRNYRIEPIPVPPLVVLHLSQHTGKISRPIVKVGDTVLKGQKISEPDGLISAAVHSSISGRVKEIKDFVHPVTGTKLPSVIIESDKLNRSIHCNTKYKEYFRFDRSELVSFIRENGIVGLGGAMFPTAVKLSPPKDKIIDYVIANGCECEPYLTCDERLMQEYPAEIVSGLKIVMYILDAIKGIVVVEDNKPEAYNKLKEVVSRVPNVEIIKVKTKYPQGAEKQLIKTVLNREVPSGGLPMDVGVVVHNVGTLYAIHNAIVKGIPLYERVVTISGDITRSGNFLVPIGTLISDIVKMLNIDISAIDKVILGGPMMGVAVNSLDIPVIKGTTGILFIKSNSKVDDGKYYPCIRCGKCVRCCPMKLMPNFLSLYIEHKLWDKVKMFSLYDCIECGVCSYICVSKRPITAQIKYAKTKLRS